MEINKTFRLLRMVVFGVASVFGLIVIILGALITHYTTEFLGFFYDYAALGIATGLLTILTLPAMLALSIARKGAITSMIAVEIGWVWFLWILWLSVGGHTVGIFFLGDCSDLGFGTLVVAVCRETSALTAFAFLTWILLMAYNVTLIALTFRLHTRGHTRVWTQDVTDTDFTALRVDNSQIVYDPKVTATYATQYPPQVGSPVTVVQQQNTGSYTQQAYPQPQVGGPYPQPQGVQPQGTVQV
jgi:hypothetical protein